jgi:hypothetical protein
LLNSAEKKELRRTLKDPTETPHPEANKKKNRKAMEKAVPARTAQLHTNGRLSIRPSMYAIN